MGSEGFLRSRLGPSTCCMCASVWRVKASFLGNATEFRRNAFNGDTLIDICPDPKRLLWIQSVPMLWSYDQIPQNPEKNTIFHQKQKSWNQWKWLKCAWSAPYIRIRIDGYVWDISGWGLIQSDPLFMPTKSRLKCLVGQLVTILGATMSAICFQRDNFGRVCQVGK